MASVATLETAKLTVLDGAPGRVVYAPSVSRVTYPAIRKVTPKAVPVSGVSRPIEVKIASERTEWEQAFRLVATTYQARGYETPNVSSFRLTPYHALLDTTVLVAKHEGRVVATFSIVLDNTYLGLPMECIYQDEIDSLRRCGRRLAETTCLADQGLTTREFVQVFLALIRLGIQFYNRLGGDTYVITVNPRHKSFYQRILGFQPLGPRRAYAAVQDAPAEAFWLDNEALRSNAPKMYQFIVEEKLPRQALVAPQLPSRLVEEFAEDANPHDRESIHEALKYISVFGSARRW
jgi:hypothetical protein